MEYQTYINGVSTSLLKEKKDPWPHFSFSTRMCNIENSIQAKHEVNVSSSFNFREVSFQRHYSEGFLKEYLNQINITWSYSHEYLFLGVLSQQGMLIKSKIPTPEKMVQIDREDERKKGEIKKKKSIIDWNTDASSSSISMYNIDFENEDTTFSSSWTLSLRREITPPPEQGEEMYSSQATINIPLEKHCSNNSMVPEHECPSSYNVEGVFGSFTFDLHRRELS